MTRHTYPSRAYTGAMTTNQTTTRPELTDILNEYGRQSYASDGAVAQGGSLKMKRCGACGGEVVFVQSKKSGKWYLADCFRKYNGGYYYVKASPHFKTCAERQERQEAYRIHAERQELGEMVTDRFIEWLDQTSDAGGDTGPEARLAAYTRIAAEIGYPLTDDK